MMNQLLLNSDVSVKVIETISSEEIDIEALNTLVYKLLGYCDLIAGIFVFFLLCLILYGCFRFLRMFSL